MGQGEGEPDPICKPRLLRALRDRPRLIDMGLRRQTLDEIQKNVCERRSVENVADRLTSSTARSVLDVTQPVVRNKARDNLDKANRTVLKKL